MNENEQLKRFVEIFKQCYQYGKPYIQKSGLELSRQNFLAIAEQLKEVGIETDVGIKPEFTTKGKLECRVQYLGDSIVFDIQRIDQEEWERFINFFCIGLSLFDIYQFWVQANDGSEYLWRCPLRKIFLL